MPDDRMGAAYEAAGPQRRAWIKTTLALVDAVHAAPPFGEECHRINPAAGFYHTRRNRVAPWAALLLGQGNISAIRLSAAVMVARLSGIEDIFALCTGEVHDPALLAALELTGVEHVFTPSLAQACAFIHGIIIGDAGQGTREVGRMLVFGDSQLEEMRPAVPSLPIWQDKTPRAGIFPDAKDARDLIAQTHPDASLLLLAEGVTGPDESFDVVYGTGPAQTTLRLTPQLAGAWVCPGLVPGFFLNTELEVGVYRSLS